MHDWTAHLEAQGGEPRDALHWQFPDDARQPESSATALVPLTHLAVLECRGADAARFLQGQTSANVEHANGNLAPLTVFCTPKGRVLANAELLQVAPEHYWLLLHASLVAPLKQQLDKYAPFYKMTLAARDDLVLLGVIGDTPATTAWPSTDWRMHQHGDTVVVRHPGPQPRWLLALPEAQAETQWAALTAELPVSGTARWQRADIAAGLAWLTQAHSDSYLPQMINWEALGGISFRKGCYTGQEVVARAHFRGQVKRRLGVAWLAGDTPPALGSEIRDGQEKRVGEVCQAEADPSGTGCQLLIVISTAAADDAPLQVEGRELTRQPLPYPLERLDPETLAAASEPAQA
ncbi:folate-binding protein YgfZ [Salinicola sp. RZ23]|uniref:CAF17-like 4Fe-4S cluster assembly/insertion protein YgfZ n=1 Tax=Salinicola sp. RZ23 TaxID=1949087 RepID=UPI000DA2458F|nr:folate-binding protein YgfZ [Salinicola sp. RZ23]